MRVRLWPILAGLALLVAIALPHNARAAVQILTFPFSTVAASGTIGPFLPQGASVCSITFISADGMCAGY